MSDHSSQESEGSTSDSSAPDGDTSSSARSTPTDATLFELDSLESPSTTTFETWLIRPRHTEATEETHDRGAGIVQSEVMHSLDERSDTYIFSAEASPVRISPTPDAGPASPETAPGSSSSSFESPSLFDPGSYSSRTYQGSSPRTAVGTSESCLERWPTSGTAWLGGFSTAASSECRNDEGGCSSSESTLAAILEEPQNVPERYSLSARAAEGILRRAKGRGRTLPSHLSQALEQVARTTTTDREDG